jgi:DNA-binding response OmpR family regulator
VARILVIEPEAQAREYLESFLQELGHEVVQLEGEIGGLDETASWPAPDLVLLEPADEASLATARALRERIAHLPIICLSSEHLVEIGESLQAAAFLMKPFRGRLLEWALAEALGELGAPAAVETQLIAA